MRRKKMKQGGDQGEKLSKNDFWSLLLTKILKIFQIFCKKYIRKVRLVPHKRFRPYPMVLINSTKLI